MRPQSVRNPRVGETKQEGQQIPAILRSQFDSCHARIAAQPRHVFDDADRVRGGFTLDAGQPSDRVWTPSAQASRMR